MSLTADTGGQSTKIGGACMANDCRIHQRIADLAREMHDRPAGEVDAVVGKLTAHAARDIPGADYAGISVVTGRRNVETKTSTHEYPRILDDIQQRHLQGPCLVALWEHQTVRVDDLERDTRWPAYQREAVAATPIRSVLSFQLFTTHQSMGVLNLYGEQPHAFTAEAEDIGLVFATHTALAWDTVRREDQFRSALASRDIIGQAKGMIMERFGTDAVEAFELLKRLSQEANTPLADIAHKLATVEQERHPA
jgi:ANTAR domain/GAF domain